jgi:hypothetical protein
MFTEIFDDLANGKLPDSDLLARRFDVAMTKKLGVVKLPPSFWMQDPKINPRTDQLLWTALLLNDASRLGLAFSALAVEHEEQQKKREAEHETSMLAEFDRILQELLRMLPPEPEDLQQQIRALADELLTPET